MRQTGQGIERDGTEALVFFKLAADNGNHNAANGIMLEEFLQHLNNNNFDQNLPTVIGNFYTEHYSSLTVAQRKTLNTLVLENREHIRQLNVANRVWEATEKGTKFNNDISLSDYVTAFSVWEQQKRLEAAIPKVVSPFCQKKGYTQLYHREKVALINLIKDTSTINNKVEVLHTLYQQERDAASFSSKLAVGWNKAKWWQKALAVLTTPIFGLGLAYLAGSTKNIDFAAEVTKGPAEPLFNNEREEQFGRSVCEIRDVIAESITFNNLSPSDQLFSLLPSSAENEKHREKERANFNAIYETPEPVIPQAPTLALAAPSAEEIASLNKASAEKAERNKIMREMKWETKQKQQQGEQAERNLLSDPNLPEATRILLQTGVEIIPAYLAAAEHKNDDPTAANNSGTTTSVEDTKKDAAPVNPYSELAKKRLAGAPLIIHAQAIQDHNEDEAADAPPLELYDQGRDVQSDEAHSPTRTPETTVTRDDIAPSGANGAEQAHRSLVPGC
jgi:hypothetical protein